MIRLENVSKTYQSGEDIIHALDDISLSITEGEFVVVLGPSGCGKTTLLNIIGGLDNASAGLVEIAGRDITSASRSELFAIRRQTVSFIFQSFNLFPGLTAQENVQFGIDAAGRKGGDSAPAILEMVGLAERADQFPHQLSGGEQQRVAIARALAKRPSLLLADEPTGALDLPTARNVLGLLQELNHERGLTSILITHNPAIGGIAGRMVRMVSGRIAESRINEHVIPAAEISW